MDGQQLLAALLQWVLQWEELARWLPVLGGMIAGGLCYRVCSGCYHNWCMNRRFQRGEVAERKAVKFLRRRGYRVVAAQLAETITVYVDGVPQRSTVRADFLVRKGWKTYIVEVKSGQQGTVRLPNVRRQLLEYKLVYRPHGVLLLDMEHHSLQEIRFAYGHIRRRRYAGYGLACLLTGLLAYLLLQIF